MGEGEDLGIEEEVVGRGGGRRDIDVYWIDALHRGRGWEGGGGEGSKHAAALYHPQQTNNHNPLPPRMVFLPECFNLMSLTSSQTVSSAEDLTSSPTLAALSELARSNEVWISGGSLHTKSEEEGKVYNTGVVFDDKGVLKASYNKVRRS